MRDLIIEIIDNISFTPGRNADYHCPPDWEVNNLAFSDYDFWFIRSGSGTLTLNNRDYPLSRGRLFLFRPGDTISACQDPDKPLGVYYCHFLPSILPLFQRLHLPVVTETVPEEMEERFSLFFCYSQKTGSPKPFDIRFLLYSIFYSWLESGGITLEEMPESSSRLDHFFKGVHYLRNHLLDSVALEDLASVCALEKSSVNKLFKRFTGKSPLQFHAQMRMQASGELLRSGMTVQQVAEGSGYADMFSFSKAFKKVMGVSPRQYILSGEENVAI